jgi:RHS repeat-associated protein
MSLPCLIVKSSTVFVLFLIVYLFAPAANAQVSMTFQGRVMYSTGEPVVGATVTMTVRFNGSTVGSETTLTDSGGNYVFQTSRSQPPCNPNEWFFQAFIAETVDDEPLKPSQSNAASGCPGPGTVLLSDLIILRPHPITLGGIVRDQFGTPVQALLITMTRTKYDLQPNIVTTATTTTDGNGHFQFNTYSRCAVVEAFTATIRSTVFQGSATSGCVLNSNDQLDFGIPLGNREGAGAMSCNVGVGGPVNVTNGNVYLHQTDYQLPGVGDVINIQRSYNSISQNIGLFGRGWTTAYDERVTTNANNQFELTLPDGRLISFATPDFFGQILKNLDGSYTVTFKAGRVHRFNASGQLVSLFDRNGNQTSLAYNGNGNLTSITDPFGRVLSVITNGSGQVLSINDSLGTVATYTYGGNNELLSVTYADNSAYHFSYVGVPAGLALAMVTDVLGNIIEQHDYDLQGRGTTSQVQGGVDRYTLMYVSPTETDVTDAVGHLTKYFFNRILASKAVTRVEGLCSCDGSQTQTWVYDDQVNVVNHTNALGQTATYTYDTNGNELTATGVLGSSSFTYNQFGEILTATDAMGGTTTSTYDMAGNLLSVTDALNNTTMFSYDARGELLTMTNPSGKVSTLAYDTSGNIFQTTDALASVNKFTYDARGRVTSATDALNFTTSYAYDAAGRVNKITRADGTFITYTYDLAGRRTKFTDALNNSNTFAYDAAYRLTGVTDAALKSVSYAYDLMSNLTGATDQLGRGMNIEYDEFNRPVKTIYPPAVTGAARLQETVEYDAVGNVTKRTDTAGRVTTFAYDNANRLISVTDPALQVTRYEYDARSDVTAVTDAVGQRYTFDYDALRRPTATTRAGTMMTFAYDAVGNRTQRTDYNNSSTNYTYDPLNRPIRITYPDASVVTFTYDKLSQLTSATNVNGTVSFIYDNVGRVTSATDIWGQIINYTYDANDRRTKISLGGSILATYAYDQLNRLTKITDSAKKDTSYVYDATGNVTTRNLPNSVVTTYMYDGLDRFIQLKHAKNNKVLASNQYSYNDAGEIIQNIDQSGTHLYSYDALDQLTSASFPATGTESYAHDAVGNRTSSHRSSSYGYQPFNRLMSTDSAGYLYDNNGNLISKNDSGGTTQFSWDFENRLTQVATPASGSVTYKYDALGRRIQSMPSNGAATNFTYDGVEVLQDKTSAGTITEYLNGRGIDNKIRQKTGNTLYYFAEDHLGSTTALTDSKGALVERQTYDAYGSSVGSAKTRYGFTGRERDPLTGLMYYRARWYDPQIGRFISEDPIGLAGGINQFAYVGNNPQNGIDPSGLYEIDVHYYLTYYLALKTGCFGDAEAQEIATGDQDVDDNPNTEPGYGGTERQRQVNAFYHALHPGSHEPYLNTHWMIATTGRGGNLTALGWYLHYSQDTFSHRGFTDPKWGHASGTHAVDKTDDDVKKAMDMAIATWDALSKFAREQRCGCQPKEPFPWDVVKRFAEASGGGYYDRRRHSIEEIDPRYLDNKIQILGLHRR